jgi:hypothetical protein
MALPEPGSKDPKMGWRHKKADTAESNDRRTAALLPPRPNPGLSAQSPLFKNSNVELALPPLRTIKLSYRQLGFFQGRKVWESSLSFSYFH